MEALGLADVGVAARGRWGMLIMHVGRTRQPVGMAGDGRHGGMAAWREVGQAWAWDRPPRVERYYVVDWTNRDGTIERLRGASGRTLKPGVRELGASSVPTSCNFGATYMSFYISPLTTRTRYFYVWKLATRVKKRCKISSSVSVWGCTYSLVDAKLIWFSKRNNLFLHCKFYVWLYIDCVHGLFSINLSCSCRIWLQ